MAQYWPTRGTRARCLGTYKSYALLTAWELNLSRAGISRRPGTAFCHGRRRCITRRGTCLLLVPLCLCVTPSLTLYQLAQEHLVALVQAALKEAGVTPADISCVAYTKVGSLQYCRQALGLPSALAVVRVTELRSH